MPETKSDPCPHLEKGATGQKSQRPNHSDREHRGQDIPLTEQLATFIACIFDSHDVVEVRRLKSCKSTWHDAGDLVKVASSLNDDNQRGQDLYVGANPRTTEGTPGVRAAACTVEKNCGCCVKCVALARCVFVDIDSCTIDEARHRLGETDLPTPTLTLMSGGGIHFYWRLIEPIEDPSIYRKIQIAIAGALNGDRAIHDFPRIMRLPGFVNLKKKYDGRRAYIVEADANRIYDVCEFEDLPAAETSPVSTPHDNGQVTHHPPATTRMLKYLAFGHETPEGERNHALYKIACDFQACAWSKNEAEDRLIPVATKSGLGVAECKTAIASAYSQDRAPTSFPDDEGADVSPTNAVVIDADEQSEPLPKLSWRPFPTHVLPPPFCDLVEEGAKALGVDPCLIALPALAGIASAIGTTRRIRLKRTWSEVSVIWAATVVVSGAVKSPAFDMAIQALRKWQATKFREHRDAEKAYETDKSDYEKKTGAWKKTATSCEDTMPDKPEAPVCERLLVTDCTVEALGPILQDNQRGLLLGRDELSGWFRSHNQYKSGGGSDTANYLEMHRAGTVVIDRKTGDHRTIYIPRAAVNICGTIQPGVLRTILTREFFESGLAARFLFAMPPKRKKRWTEDELSERTEKAFADVIQRLLELRPNENDDGDPTPVDVPLSPDAKRAWIDFYEEHAERQHAAGDDDLAAAFSKLEGYAARFALIFWLVRWASDDRTITDEIDVRAIEAGAELARWFCHEDERIYATFVETEEDRADRGLIELVKRIKARGKAATAREVCRGSRRFKRAHHAKAALDDLVACGAGHWHQTKGGEGGRPTTEFIPVGAVGADITPSEGVASGGFVSADGADGVETEGKP